MNREDIEFKTLLQILREELIPAMGCTEPIAVAYASAKARDVLGKMPDRVEAQISSSIIKNVKSVIVPNTHNLKGIEASVAAGIVVGNANKELEVIADAREEQQPQIEEYLKATPIVVKHLERGHVFDIIITVYAGSESAEVQITDFHTNIVSISKNGEVIFSKNNHEDQNEKRADRTVLSMRNIWNFAALIKPEDVADTIGKQIQYNSAISKEGLNKNYGANVGKLLIKEYGSSPENEAAASAAAGSDARMSGCEMPVIINSGSGNQGLACSMPVITYARRINASEQQLYHALALSNLTTIYQKTGIGTLSAYCGVISAGIGAAAGISYLKVGSYEAFEKTVSNSLGISSGVICDGAKPSCAAKSALAIETGLFGLNMYCEQQNLKAGDGIIGKDANATVHNVWKIASDGMAETNDEIIDVMIKK
jgi:L-cysteine desulfidase